MIGNRDTKSSEVGNGEQPRPRILYPIPEVARLLGSVSERYVWSLIEKGKLRTVQLGRRRLVPHDALGEYLAGLNVPMPDGPGGALPTRADAVA